MKKLNLRKQYWAYAVLAAVCAGFIYTPQIAEAKFGAGATTSTFDTKDVVTFVGKSWYVVDQSSAGGDNNKITLFCKDVWSTNPSDFVKFNDYVSGTLDVLNDYGSTPYQNGTSRMDTVSKLMRKMQELYEGLAYTTLAEKTAKDAIQAVNLEDVNVTGVRFYAPSKTEVESYISMTLPGDSQFPTDNSVARATVDYWTRSPDTSIDRALYYRAGGLDISYKGATEGEFALRPVIQVDQDAAGSTLVNTDPTKTSGSYFSSKVDLATNGTFVGDTGSGDPQAYTSVADAAPNLDCTYLVLDGTSIKIKNGTPYQGIVKQGTDPVEYSTNIAAILVNEDTSHDGVAMASGSQFSDVSEKIDYIATLAKDADYDTNSQLSGNLTGVEAGTYGLKIFGIDNDNHTATQLGSGVINKLEKTNNGLNLTIGSVNGGFVITLKNGAGITLDGNASNAITVYNGTSKLKLAGKELSGTVSVYQDAELDVSGGGIFSGNGNQITGMMKVVDENEVTFTKTIDIYARGTLELINAKFNLNVVNEGNLIVKGDVVFGANANLKEGGILTIESGNVKFGGTDIENKVVIQSGASLEAKVANLKNEVTNNSGTVKLGGGSDFVALNSAAKITGGAVVIGSNDSSAEKVSVKVSQFENVSSINIGDSDTLKFTGDVTADKTFPVSGAGSLDVDTTNTNNSKIVLTGDTTLAGITITSGNLQIPAEWILNTSGGAGNYTVADEDYIKGSNTDSVLTLKLANGKMWKLADLNTVLSTTDGIGSNYTGKVKFDGEFNRDGATISVKAFVSGTATITDGKIGVYDTGGDILYPTDGSSLSVPDNYVNVASATTPYDGTPVAVTKVSIDGTTDFVAKGLMIDQSGNVELEIKNGSNVTLVGGTDGNGDVSTPLVQAVPDGTDYKAKALSTTVVVDESSTFNIGYNYHNAKMKIATLENAGTVNVDSAYLEVTTWDSGNGEINVNNDSVLNVGGMDESLLNTAAEAVWADGKSVKMEVGFNAPYNMDGKKLHVGGNSSEQVYFGNGSLLAVSLPSGSGHAESEFNGSTTIPGIISNVASLGSADGASIYLDGALEESKYYVIVSGDINPDGTQTVWDADHIYTSDAALELVPVTDPDAMLGIGIGNFKNMIVLKATEGDILMAEPALNPYHPIMEKMVDAPASSDLNTMYADMKNVYRKNHKAGIDAMNSLMGLNSTSSMMRSGIVAANLMSQTTLDHVSLMERSSLNPNYGHSKYAEGLRNTVAAKDIFEPEYVDVGRSSAVMPVPSRQYTPSKQQNYIAKSYSGKSYSEKSYSEKSYKAEAPKHYHSSYGSSYNDEDKKVWAEYIHSKETTDGMAVTGNGDNSTSGAVVGFDLWSGDHSFGGVSVAYSQTDVNNSASSTVTKNDIDTYGVGIYTRHDYSHCSMIFDAGYNYSKNDIKQEQNFGHNFEITGKPKVQIYNAGLRYEHSSHVSDKAAFVPYVGVRYTMVDPDSYCTNIGFKYKSKEKDIVSVPLGIRLSLNLYGNGFIVKPYLDFGYQWNFGQKNWKQTVMYDDVMSTLKYDVMDSNSHFINGGLQVYASNFNFGAGYRHSKSNHAKNNKWTINANWDL